jgi:hypothetical protein
MTGESSFTLKKDGTINNLGQEISISADAAINSSATGKYEITGQ